jgi:predicted transglutaminase-like cysteine proteinase
MQEKDAPRARRKRNTDAPKSHPVFTTLASLAALSAVGVKDVAGQEAPPPADSWETTITPRKNSREPRAGGWQVRVQRAPFAEPDFVNSYNPTLFLNTKGDAIPPSGHVEFCQTYAKLCDPHQHSPRELMERHELDEFTQLQLSQALQTAFSEIVQVADKDQMHGRPEKWDIPVRLRPDGYKEGDCEDFDLWWVEHLAKRGFRRNNLVIAAVRTEPVRGVRELHAVLVVRTKDGDYILDNRYRAVRSLAEARAAGYTFISRQSFLDPRVWLAVVNPVD